MCIGRYLAIFHSQTHALSHNSAIVVISFIWLVPVCIQTPFAIFYQHTVDWPWNGKLWTLCGPAFPSKSFEKGFFVGVVFLTCYMIPLCFLTVFYTLIGVKVWRRSVSGIKGSKAERSINRSKIRIVRMLIVVTVIFALSWLPLYSIQMFWYFGPVETVSESLQQMLFTNFKPIAQWLGSANSCANPFIYCYFSDQFRRAILTIFKGFPCCRRMLERRGSAGQTTMITKMDV